METKPGIRTTEFWQVAIVDLLALAMMIADYLPAETGMKVIAGVTGVYAIARGVAKHGMKPE